MFIQSAYCNDSIPSKIIFYREHNIQSYGMAFKLFVGDSMVVKLKDNSYFIYSCSPGEYDFKIDKYPKSKVHLKVEQGKTYYLRFGIKTGFWSAIPEFLLVDSISAYPVISNRSMRKLDNLNTPLIRSKNRFGLIFNIGSGFEKCLMATTTDGKESTLSFGGGLGIGLQYGHEVNKHFDIAIDFNYQESFLGPILKNAEVTFSRGIVSITPSYILPIDGGDAMRMKLGAGLDDYFSPGLSIQMSNLIGGFNEDWSYKNSIGYHLSINYELNTSEKWSLNYGLKWYTVSYSFDKGGLHFPTENKLKKPNGSGIDFLWGFNYHF